MDKEINIVIVESDPSISSLLESSLIRSGYPSCRKVLPDASIHAFDELGPDLAIVGPSLDALGSTKCVNRLKLFDRKIPILILEENGLSAEGAAAPFDGVYYIGRDPQAHALCEAIERAIRRRSEDKSNHDFPALIGRSDGINRVREQIHRVCEKDVNILITGESGTGKELVARAIHYGSTRSEGPLVKINCGALPDDLLESEVFGFQKGAFTGAHKNKPGRMELADGGTLFVDEIGDLSLTLQVKFLQVLEDKAFSRLGGTEDKSVDARVVAATNADLRQMVVEGAFRKDLFYRLNVVHLEATPLRERKEDIPLLVHYFMDKYCYELKKEGVEAPDEVMDFFSAYLWPGNVRELENVVRRAIVLKSWDFVFSDPQMTKNAQVGENTPASGPSTRPLWSEDKLVQLFKENDFSLKKITKAYVSEMEKEAILKALRETHWNRKRAAELLQVSYKTLLNRILEFELKP